VVDARRQRRDGSTLDVSASYSLVADNGRPTAVALIERDVTRQRRAEHELRESEQRFRMLADSAPVLIWMSGSDGTIEFANREFAECCGLAPETLIGRRWMDLLHEDDIEAVSAKLAQGGQRARDRIVATVQLRAASGRYRWMKLSAILRFGENGRPAGIVASMADIDAQIDAERSLRLGWPTSARTSSSRCWATSCATRWCRSATRPRS
jgi:two-component system, chemotaxis family, CheB/CheR fusion protein